MRLRALFPGQRVLTYAAPNNQVNDTFIDYLNDYSISCRIGSNGTTAVLGEKLDMYRIRGIGFSENSDFAYVQAQIDTYVSRGEWVVQYFHTVTSGTPYESVGTSVDTLDAHCKVLYDKYYGKVWFGSFEEVSIYARQHEAVKIEKGVFDADSMTFTLSCSLDKDTYNIPMTMKLYLPNGTSSYTVTVDGVTREAELTSDENGACVLVRDLSVYGTTVKLTINN